MSMNGNGAAKVATGVIDALKGQPLVIALIVLNLLYMVGGFWIFREERTANRTAITQLLDRCTAK